MNEHYDALETRASRPARGRAVFPAAGGAAQGHGSAGLCRASQGYRPRIRRQPGRAGAPAGAAQVGTPGPAQGRPAVRRVRGRAARIVWAAVHLARPDLRARAGPCRPLARRAGAVRGGLPARRRGAEHLQLSPDARRLHFRCLGARAGLRGDSGRSRQYRGAVRADRGLSAGRLQRHAGFPEDPARCRRKRRSRCLLDQARAGLGRGLSEIAAGRDQRRAASTPIRRSAPPISAWSRSRPRRATA